MAGTDAASPEPPASVVATVPPPTECPPASSVVGPVVVAPPNHDSTTSASVGAGWTAGEDAGQADGETFDPEASLPDWIHAHLEERPSKMPRTEKGKGKGKEIGKSRHGAPFAWSTGYKDIVWTPEMQQKQESDKSKVNALVWALYKAVDLHGSQNVTLSQLGSDFKVAELKKDEYLRRWRLLDILKEYDKIFELTTSTDVAGGIIVKLHPGAHAALPDAENCADEVTEEMLLLPERIEQPKSQVEKVQALRIELIHALHRRGGKVAIQELGQEPRLQEKKKLVTVRGSQSRKLVDWVKVFPENFELSPDNGNVIVELKSAACHDVRMIERALGKKEEPDKQRDVASSRKGKNNNNNNNSRDGAGHARETSGRGRDGDRERRDRDRRGRDRTPLRSSREGHHPYGTPPLPYGYPGLPPPQSLAYGAPPPSGSYGTYPSNPQSNYGGYQPGYPPPAGYQPPPNAYPGYPASYPPAAPANPAYPPQQAAPCSGYPAQQAAFPPSTQAGYPPPSAAPGFGTSVPAPVAGYPPPAPAGGYPPPSYPPSASYPHPGQHPPPSGYSAMTPGY
mmetsp:Transcript_71472/g.149405  ORF Transcript_71472/g.149405 Transcript_71472/m.149405 type:complete len:566 (+) Transcript_71472:172-1869(+)|eukprot:CAMPEP_0206463200 /NCGR_PEP_ID=MMETSP0324_2-20121206/26445_1 /ASSEMBLY_ACC=CAM_ASM_000836 /TAXON_ID=2866 /ORGANISM="Crypthecodinium cohnii, Strain Seligo" /LENGTH=565 /DNA_ID=CAMNT_0053935527 /DNA_START=100 /DNA_END=1797 /DNA_ORIENTATION=+